ncbi:cysteine proteinase [Pisolithus tinctorius]|uniref:ubiquitinyl hydrolase 1 n=1 Tax=Pisolithus tinctorius Marx 270 TaxID=870435 RepID=A0A0C3PI44_PISTI|nr:cysteine proteinase [Pisolithus tinctorius]KIO07729.1 hypothetical protein M404DRAFT_23581 [Pisolithus tinctorius Marx 270]
MNLPSPAPSPSSKTKDLDPGSNSRKRQRSESSQSTTSSVKRSASEGPASTPIHTATDETTHTACVSDSDIDSYMMVQGEDDVCAMTLLGPAQPVAPVNLTPSEKFEYIKRFRCKSMQVGETWFLVSRQWYRRWEFACQGTMDKGGAVEEKDIGPVDNTPLVAQDGNLTSDLTEGVNVEFLPEDAWNAFTAWYGTPTHALPRSVISRGQFGQPSLELRPPRLRVLHLAETKSDQTDRPPEYVTLSTKDTVTQLSRQLVARLSARSDVPYRIWRIQPGEYEGVQFPAEKLLPSGAELLEISNKTLEESLIEFHDPFVVEFQKDGKWISDQLASAAQPAVSEPAPLFSQDDDFFSRLASTSQQPAQQRQTPPPTTVTTNTSFSKSKDTQITTFRPRVFSKTKVVQEPGTLGLANMGNTCFMNSALQCLAHTEELANYFLSGVYQSELNPENPLGMQGAIAEAFGSLLHRIWAKDLSATTYSPREFKLQLQRFAPQFSGYQQHDSQELVAFLLDGLHEDLNRVRKKPYVEKPDWEGGGDLELAQLAQQSWQGYMRRNDSVIVDLFQGQYQSTLVCPECHKVSITFDPFMYLTLPIPIERKWSHTIRYVPWDPSKPHVEVPVEIVRGATFKDLRSLLGRWMGVPAENLLTMEVFGHRFYKNLDDTVQCDDMSENDVIFCYELPCNARQSRSYKAKNDDPFIVPVFLSDLHARPMTYGYRSHAAFGHPFFAVIDREDARTVDGIYSAVVDYLQRWSHNARDLYVWEEGQATLVDAAPIIVPPIDSLTEIKVNGDAAEGMLIEDDITDAFGEQDAPPEGSVDIVLRKVGVKTTFDLRFQSGQKDYTASFGSYNSQRLETWDDRIEQMGEDVPLLKEWDALYCDFDRNMKTYFFGDEISHWEHSTWEAWDKFIHPEYAEAKRTSLNKNSRVISIDDCLEEFTKEEKLGEDDLWYCPRCKKHQQATKKFDLWKVPDILAVHLKRFSNSRALRDKIDAFVDFPIEGFDLTRLVGEREVGKRLNESGANLQELGIHDLDEPLIYDLYAVDEHLGGLGGGHYRACALNHVIGQWYHFDDSYVTRTEPMHAVNANAYLLFYKRRSNRPLGGKTLQKIEEVAQGSMEDDDITPAEQQQLPTPPEETSPPAFVTAQGGFCAPRSPGKATPRSSSPLDDLPTFDESQNDPLIQDSLLLDTSGLHASEPGWSRIPSPTSSAATEGDDDYQKLSSPDESLNRGWDDNSPASAVAADLSPSLRPMDG